MLVSREQLHQVKRALGRFYGQIPAPSKTDLASYREACLTIELLLDADANNRLNISDLTIAEVQARVEAGELEAASVLEAERNGKARKSLIDWLEAL